MKQHLRIDPSPKIGDKEGHFQGADPRYHLKEKVTSYANAVKNSPEDVLCNSEKIYKRSGRGSIMQNWLQPNVVSSQCEDVSQKSFPICSGSHSSGTKPFDLHQCSFMGFEEEAVGNKGNPRLVAVWKDNLRRNLDGSHVGMGNRWKGISLEATKMALYPTKRVLITHSPPLSDIHRSSHEDHLGVFGMPLNTLVLPELPKRKFM
ncbi:hypothetical protein VNO78_20248 [Psophocarpus tetragonolobus]|uniref:Uncharacterized protein n=1 Tax=Psophocarpus tetragonolobus TaxID=3891 RepID=A0AAN9XGZ7_PSOTE